MIIIFFLNERFNFYGWNAVQSLPKINGYNIQWSIKGTKLVKLCIKPQATIPESCSKTWMSILHPVVRYLREFWWQISLISSMTEPNNNIMLDKDDYYFGKNFTNFILTHCEYLQFYPWKFVTISWQSYTREISWSEVYLKAQNVCYNG